MKPGRIVICGFPRSGSTLLYCMLRQSVTNFRFFDEEKPAVSTRNANAITKRPVDCRFYRQIIKRRPDTRFIVTIRDPRSIVTSRRPDGSGYCAAGDFYQHRANRPRHSQSSPLSLAFYVDKVIGLPPPYTPEVVRYEDLVAAPDAVQERLGAAYDLEYRYKFSDFHERENCDWEDLMGMGPVDPSRVEGWRKHPLRIVQQFSRLPALFGLVERYGYETTRQWFADVVGVDCA